MKRRLVLFVFFVVVYSCESSVKPTEKDDSANVNLLTDYPALLANNNLNAVIEIPAGSTEKWELNKVTGIIERDIENGLPRTINYLGYPSNYGMIPRTLLSKENGGDGDPLDVIVIGPKVDRGTVVESKVIGVLYLLDNGEKDDKIIAVSSYSSLYKVNSIAELDSNYFGISESLKIWFTNYKGPGKMVSNGFGEKEIANQIITSAIDEFEILHNDD